MCIFNIMHKYNIIKFALSNMSNIIHMINDENNRIDDDNHMTFYISNVLINKLGDDIIYKNNNIYVFDKTHWYVDNVDIFKLKFKIKIAFIDM
jgi:hypothetical protein